MSVACSFCSSGRPKLYHRISGSGRISIFYPWFWLQCIEGGGFEFLPSYMPLCPLGPLGIGSTLFPFILKYLDNGNGREGGGGRICPLRHYYMPYNMDGIHWGSYLLRSPHLSITLFVFPTLGILSGVEICGQCLQWSIHIL